jgi:hypothetical protein
MPISSIPSDRDGRPAKRVEFSPSLGSIDPQVPNHPDGNTTAWDAETGAFCVVCSHRTLSFFWSGTLSRSSCCCYDKCSQTTCYRTFWEVTRKAESTRPNELPQISLHRERVHRETVVPVPSLTPGHLLRAIRREGRVELHRHRSWKRKTMSANHRQLPQSNFIRTRVLPERMVTTWLRVLRAPL